MTRVRVAITLAAALCAAGAAVASTTTAAATTRLYAFMDGEAETAGGDTDGHARIGISFDRARGRVCFDLRKFKLETAATAHVHRGRTRTEGPVVVTLFNRPTGAGKGKVTGCADHVPRATIDRILADPNRYYADVHTQRYPSGSVRGQLTTRRIV